MGRRSPAQTPCTSPAARSSRGIERAAPDRSTPILVYCGSGTRSAFAAKTLEELGYEHVTNLDGGIVEWKRSGLPVVVSESLAPAQRTRYSRHLLIPEVGEEGQLRLLDARILLIGAGGLGSPAALYLAAAGVGTLGIVDDDAVDATNLQRQIVHSTDRLGEPKVESAKRTIEALNPDVNVRVFRERLTSENVDRILGEGWDAIVDGADNFPTRYLVNDASVWHGIPVIHGSIFRFEGQVTVFEPGEGPCYRCLFPQPPPPELAPSCAEGGVLGVLPGHHRLAPGERGAQARARHRRPAHRPAAALRRARTVLHRGRAAQGSGVPGLRRVADDHGVHRLRRVLPAGRDARMSTVRIPPPLRDATEGQPVVAAEGGTVGDLLDDLVARFPALDGQLQHANVYVDGEDIRVLDELETPVDATSTVILLPAMAGGL